MAYTFCRCGLACYLLPDGHTRFCERCDPHLLYHLADVDEPA